jgi:hypothetical protein
LKQKYKNIGGDARFWNFGWKSTRDCGVPLLPDDTWQGGIAKATAASGPFFLKPTGLVAKT